MVGRLSLVATSSAKYMCSSKMMQTIWSWSWDSIRRRKLSLQFSLMVDKIWVISPGEISESDNPSGIGRKLKQVDRVLGSGELKTAWEIVTEKPLEWRIEPSWSIGVIWPWYGHGTSTNLLRRRSLCNVSFFIFLLQKNGKEKSWDEIRVNPIEKPN